MKVLFLHSNIPNYVTDGLFHGLRELLGNDCIDIPRNDPMYTPLSPEASQKTGSKGKTLYGLLEDNSVLEGRRVFWQRDLSTYDLVVVADIFHLWNEFWDITREVPRERVVIVDGIDSPAIFPYLQMKERFRTKPWSFMAPIRSVRYFKREVVNGAETFGMAQYLPKSFHSIFSVPRNLQPISMSIPRSKITNVTTGSKTKDFVDYVVDKEVAERIRKSFVAVGQWKPLFEQEEDYYRDIQVSRFGITTRREGWDCLRHYEYAANGCVMCFKDLETKPEKCAPYGLDKSNCIIYHNADDLMKKISSLGNYQYEDLLNATYQWIDQYTTVKVAERFLEACSLKIPRLQALAT